MEEQLQALGMGVGARVVEELLIAGDSLRWNDLYRALGDDVASRGTLTKTLKRMASAGLVAREGERYVLLHIARTATLIQAAAELSEDIASARALALADRARRLRKARMRIPSDAGSRIGGDTPAKRA